MVNSFEVGAVFKIIDEASPGLRKILEQVRAISVAVEKAREALASLGKTPGLGLATGETNALATAWKGVATEARAASKSMNIAAAAGRRAAAAGATSVGVTRGGSGGGSTAPSNTSSRMLRAGTSAAELALGAVGYGVYQAVHYDDAALLMAQHAGVSYAENHAKFRKMLEDATIATGFDEHDVSLAAQQELRMFGDTGGSNGINVLPKMLRYAATEARLKGTGLEESMTSLTGLSHMLQLYGENDVDRIAPAFSALSVRSPMTLGQQERAFGYAVPLLHSALGLDPLDVMASSVALARAGITNTKAGTWIREALVNSMPGTSLMSKFRFKKHEGALKELGLVDDDDKPTWFVNGMPNEMALLNKVAENLPKVPIERRAAVLQAFAGKQGAGALSVLAEPAVAAQVTAMRNEMTNPETVNRVRNFTGIYGEQSTLQGARTTLQEFNVTMGQLGDTVMPAVNGELRDFKSVLEGVRGVLPGPKPDAPPEEQDKWKVGTRALEGATVFGLLGGAIAGPPGAAIGGAGGFIGGGFLGIAEGYMKTKEAAGIATPYVDDFGRIVKDTGMDASQASGGISKLGSAIRGLMESIGSMPSVDDFGRPQGPSKGAEPMRFQPEKKPSGNGVMKASIHIGDGRKLATAMLRYTIADASGPVQGSVHHDITHLNPRNDGYRL